jgi:hypothetical protein
MTGRWCCLLQPAPVNFVKTGSALADVLSGEIGLKMFRATCLLLCFTSLATSQTAAVAMPAWLKPYPGAAVSPQISSPALIETTYTASAKPNEVVAHYGQLLAAASVPFNSNFDGAGTSIRAAATACDLLIKIREQGDQTNVRVSCATKSATPLSGGDVVIANGPGGRPSSRPSFGQPVDFEKWKTEHRKRMDDESAALARHIANNKAGKFDEQVWPRAPENDAPPPVWPAWLVNVKGGRLNPEQGVGQSRTKYLLSKFVSGAPMTTIYNFYEDLLNANGYHVYSSKLGTGQTIDGIVQNADGYVEGAHKPYDITGPSTVIRVTFSRFHLNDPIDVRIKFTAHPRF